MTHAANRLGCAAQDPLVVDRVRGGAFVRGVAPAAKARLAEWVNPLYFSDAEIARIAGALSRRCSVESSLLRCCDRWLSATQRQRYYTQRCAGLVCNAITAAVA